MKYKITILFVFATLSVLSQSLNYDNLKKGELEKNTDTLKYPLIFDFNFSFQKNYRNAVVLNRFYSNMRDSIDQAAGVRKKYIYGFIINEDNKKEYIIVDEFIKFGVEVIVVGSYYESYTNGKVELKKNNSLSYFTNDVIFANNNSPFASVLFDSKPVRINPKVNFRSKFLSDYNSLDIKNQKNQYPDSEPCFNYYTLKNGQKETILFNNNLKGESILNFDFSFFNQLDTNYLVPLINFQYFLQFEEYICDLKRNENINNLYFLDAYTFSEDRNYIYFLERVFDKESSEYIYSVYEAKIFNSIFEKVKIATFSNFQRKYCKYKVRTERGAIIKYGIYSTSYR